MNLDVEALLDSAAEAISKKSERRSDDLVRPRKDRDGDVEMKSPRGSSDKGSGGGKSRRRSRSPNRGQSSYSRRRDYSQDRSEGDFYRGTGRPHTRSVSQDDSRHYRPNGGAQGSRSSREPSTRDHRQERTREARDDNHRGRGGRDRRDRDARRGSVDKDKSKTPPLTEDERDRRTVFVQQLAARLRTRDLVAFFSKVGAVKEAQIVKDRVSGRSKGVGYVEFKNEESVQAAIQLTGQKLLGIPIIAQLTEAEKNRQTRTTDNTQQTPGIPFFRLYVGNIHFSITEADLTGVFDPFGEVEFVSLQKEEGGRSRGYGCVQFREPADAKEALTKLNGFDLASRPIRVGLGNDKFTDQSTANLLQRWPQQAAAWAQQKKNQGSGIYGSGGRGAHAGGQDIFDRPGGRNNDKATGGSGALDDTDVGSINYGVYSRMKLMANLARTAEPTADSADTKQNAAAPRPKPAPVHANVPQASRCIVLHEMFNTEEEEARDPVNWRKELQTEIRKECEAKYGHVLHLDLDENNNDVYVKFERIEGGEKAMKGLNGRFFAGRTITAQPMVDAVYSTLFGRTRAG